MPTPTPAQRAAELRKTIDHHNHLYYVEAAPVISDREFDRLLEELQNIEKAHPELVTPDSPTQPIPPNYTISPTGRYSNALYDVIQFKLSLVVDAARIPQVLAALSRNRFITVYNTNVTAVDAGEHQAAGYIYGPQAVVQLDLDCEALFLREWTKPFMPRVVRAFLGVQDEQQTPPAQ